ncbi:MAG: hypothetical protein CMI54_02680 [Parcubacteria group bacterium]|jgi:uncharacterized phiE125 gp8 family phage protein|nr:hypothetical protein [Parcubacteria group bacterium]|tara:strand:+ start:2032 stop:2622 length:591 start_codon:yes stop_codon:yes gene_type:complete
MSNWGLNTSVEPAIEPVTLDEMKDFLKVEHTEDDALIFGLIVAARGLAEEYTHRAFISQTLIFQMDAIPSHGVIDLPKAPLQSVTTFQYVDSDGNTQTWGSSNYRVDTVMEPGRVTAAYDVSWPTVRAVTGAVTITYVAGYGSTRNDIPEGIRLAIMLMVSDLYENGSDVVIGASVSNLPTTSKTLLNPYRNFGYY